MNKILIVEDDNDSRVLLERLLRARGYSVDTAVNGIQALENARKSRPDIIVSDILMPEMDGFELCRRVKQDKHLRTVPFIFYTATYIDPQDEKLAMSLGASRFVVKPLDPDEFVALIKSVIEGQTNNKLPVTEHAIADDKQLNGMYANALARELDKKVKDLQQEKARLRESEYKYRRLVESLRDEYFFCTRDTNGSFTYISPSIENVLGYSQDDFAKNFTNYLYDDSFNKMFVNNTQLCVRGLSPSPCEIEVFHRNGSTHVLELSDVPVFNNNREVIAVESIARDITERKRLENQLLQAHKMEAVGQLTGGIAHDFNNILSAIIGFGHLLTLKIEEGNPSRKFVDQILAASNKAAHLTQSLLAFSRKQLIAPEPININKLVHGVGNLLSTLIGDNIEFKTVLHSPPDASDEEGIIVLADYGQIEQTLINLVTNARDAMPAGGKLTIETGYMQIDEQFIQERAFGKIGNYALITVTDTGEGMDETTKWKIFEPFFTTKETGKGTGLGLAMAYGIIKQHDGYIWVDSELHKGSVFYICLPTTRTQSITPREVPKTAPDAIKGGTETVLIAEDDENLRTLIKTVLQKYGYRVIEASDGQEAIDKFMENRESVQLIISDLMMPKKGGNEVSSHIRKISPHMKVIILSGYDDDMIRRKQLDENNLIFLSKPVYPEALLLKIREVFETA